MEKPNSNLLITESPNRNLIQIKKHKFNNQNFTINENIFEKKRPMSNSSRQKKFFDYQNLQFSFPYINNSNSNLREHLKKYINDMTFTTTNVEPYIVPYTPKMINIINKNKLITEEIQNHIWKYEYLLPKPNPYKTSKLMQVISTQFFPLEIKNQNIKKKKKIELYRPNYFKKF